MATGVLKVRVAGAWVAVQTGPEGPPAHHVTHEPGGGDPIVALSAAILTSGTMPMARLATSGLAGDYLTGTGAWADLVAAIAALPPSLRVVTVVSAATVIPNADTTDLLDIVAQAAALAIANHTGTPRNGHALTIRIRDNGTGRAISWGTAYMTGQALALPATTVAAKLMHVGFRWSPTYNKWVMVALTQEP